MSKKITTIIVQVKGEDYGKGYMKLNDALGKLGKHFVAAAVAEETPEITNELFYKTKGKPKVKFGKKVKDEDYVNEGLAIAKAWSKLLGDKYSE